MRERERERDGPTTPHNTTTHSRTQQHMQKNTDKNNELSRMYTSTCGVRKVCDNMTGKEEREKEKTRESWRR